MAILNSSASSSRRAFTLIEMMIAISMIVILSGIMLGYSNVSRKHVELASNEAKLLGLLFNAKALGTSFVLNPPENQQICAYGAHVNITSRIAFIFQDLMAETDSCEDSDNIFTAGEALPGSINQFHLSDLLEFGPDTGLENIIFIPPDPIVIINGDDTKSAKIVVQSKEDEDVQFTVVLNHAGQISVE